MDPKDKVKIGDLKVRLSETADKLRKTGQLFRDAGRPIEADCLRDMAQVIDEMKATVQ